MTVEQAAQWLYSESHGVIAAALIVGVADAYKTAYRSAAAKLHPDRGGDPAKWNQLQEAKRVLDQHHAKAPASA